MQEFPMFFGVDHYNNELIKEMGKLLEKYAGRGTRLFIEISPNGVEQSLKVGIQDPYDELIKLAHKKRIEIIPLDKNVYYRFTKWGDIFLGKKQPADKKERYVLFNVRERHWKRVLQKANGNDIVIMHPAHLRRIQRALNISKKRIMYFPEIPHQTFKPLSRKELKRLKLERIRLRQQRRLEARAKRKPR